VQDAICQEVERVVPITSSAFMKYYASFLLEENTAEAVKVKRIKSSVI
jgi:hypothetical protein